MKGIKKLLTGILAATMIMGSTMTAFATENPGTPETSTEQGTQQTVNASIKITNAKNGQEYKVYRVFDYVPASTTDMSSGIYKLSDKFSGFTSTAFTVVNGVISGTITEVDESTGQPTAAAQAAAVQLGKDVMTYVGTTISPDASKTASFTDENGAAVAEGELTIPVTAYGYYVVNSSLGVAVSVNTTVPEAQITEKNDVPKTEKKVQEGNDWGDTSDANIGDVVKYKSIVKIPKGGVHNVKFTDEMTGSLDLVQDSIVVTVEGASQTDVVESIEKSTHGFTIKFKDSYTSDPEKHKAAKEYVITYSATLNATAKIKGEETTNEFGTGNDNRSTITYGNNTATDWDFTRTYTYPVKIVKINSQKQALEGAEFTLAKDNASDTLIKFVKDGDTYRVATSSDTNATTTLEVGLNGIIIKGLDRDVYRLTETKAPTGYNLLTPDSTDVTKHYVTFTIAASPVCGKDTEALQAILDADVPAVTYTSDYLKTTDNTTGSFTILSGLAVVNTTGTVLPSTGGIGTTIFYIIGGILIVAGVAYFIVRRKSNAE